MIRPGGILLVSVPDITVMSHMILDKSLTMDEHWMVMKMIYGAQFDAGDFHNVCYNNLFYFCK